MSFYGLISNHLFNGDFFIPGTSRNFPAGWQKYRKGRNCSIAWEIYDKICCIRIKNRSSQMASICQQKTFSIPVDKGQVWKATARLRAEEAVRAAIIVHFISPSSRPLNTVMDFFVEPDNYYYTGILSIPVGAEYALLEIGLKEAGAIRIEEAEFIKLFPAGEYSTDHRGRLNINTLEKVKHILEPVTVQRIVEPVKIEETFRPARQSVDICEDIAAGTVFQSSSVQDVLLLATYSFCVLNLGTNSVKVHLQISPDAVHWLDEPGASYSIKTGESKILVGSHFLRYARLVFIVEHGETSQLRIFFQGNGG